MGCEGEHDEISILKHTVVINGEHDEAGKPTHQTVYYMSSIGVMSRVCALSTDEVHNFMLSFSWHTCIGDDDLELESNASVLCLRGAHYVHLSTLDQCSSSPRPSTVTTLPKGS